MSAPLAQRLSILRWKEGTVSELDDLIVNEFRLALKTDDDPPVLLDCSPELLPELILGRLFCEGAIRSTEDIESLSLDEEHGSASVRLRRPGASSAGSALPPLSGLKFQIPELLKNLDLFYAESTLQKETAGVHRCALCCDDGPLLACVDIRRHNAFDKVIGCALERGISLNDKYMITSGRVPLDFVEKSAAAGLPMLVSRSAPTVAAVSFAQHVGLTLLGFSREGRFNLYSHPERLL